MDENVLFVCVGSACHHKGVHRVLPVLQELLEKHGFGDTIIIKGSFCLGPCTSSIVMKYRETEFLNISPENIHEKFAAEIHPALTSFWKKN